MRDREFDVVMHGATGFVGRLISAELARSGEHPRMALSGRSKDKLEAVRAALGVDWPLLIVDAADPAALAELARSTTVVATTVGPYSRFGLPLVGACAAAGTAYLDLNGELSFARACVDTAHAEAAETGARIVLSAGFESIPSDLGVFALHERAAADGAGTLEETVAAVVSLRAAMSGGSASSLRTEVDLVHADPALKRLLADPYALSPGPRGADGAERDVRVPRRDPLLGRWVAPFVAAPYNSRIVRRSNALLDDAYGADFRYREVMALGSGPLTPLLSGALALGSAALEAALSMGPTRSLLDRVLPGDGSGPSEEARRKGHFRIEIHTRTSSGARYVATVAAKGDPGYTATAVMFSQSALSLAFDEPAVFGGVLTPAVALGSRLIGRLRSAGLELSVSRQAVVKG